MLISESHKFLFVHIPKCAGVSIMKALEGIATVDHPLCLGQANKHETAPDFISRNGRDVYQQFRSFAIIRDPIDRFISRFCFTSQRQAHLPGSENFRSLDTFVAAIENKDATLMSQQNRFIPQHRYIMDDGKIIVDRVLCYETLKEDFESILSYLDIKSIDLQKKNASKRKNIIISENVISFVQDYYAQDYDLLGYSREQSAEAARRQMRRSAHQI